ncbi:hypothetical protein [Ensifer canadensis]
MNVISAVTRSLGRGLAERVGRSFGSFVERAVKAAPTAIVDAGTDGSVVFGRGLGRDADDLRTAFVWAAEEAATALKTRPEALPRLIEDERLDGTAAEPGSLFDEFTAIVALLALSQAIGLDGIPVLARPATEEADGQTAAPLFDFTNLKALQALAAEGAESGALVREALSRSRMVRFVTDIEAAAIGAFDLFAASLETRLLAFSFGSGGGAAAASAAQIQFRLETHIDKLIVDRFFQSRYAPVQFGKSKIIVGPLKAGIYCFQTLSMGTPPPEIDPAVHSVSYQTAKSHTVNF